MIDVEHIATLLCKLAENAYACGVVNLYSGRAQCLREPVEQILRKKGRCRG